MKIEVRLLSHPSPSYSIVTHVPSAHARAHMLCCDAQSAYTYIISRVRFMLHESQTVEDM